MGLARNDFRFPKCLHCGSEYVITYKNYIRDEKRYIEGKYKILYYRVKFVKCFDCDMVSCLKKEIV